MRDDREELPPPPEKPSKHLRRVYRPIRVVVAGEDFDVTIGRPGRPVVYRVKKGTRRRVKSDDPVLTEVAVALRREVDQAKEVEEL